MALWFYAFTLFISAFLLFLVQPMIGKMILPGLGGTPQVWNTCMLFFQTALLAGYAYTHTVSIRLPLRRQLLLHGVLLLVPLLVLFAMGRPFNVSGFEPPPGANPITYTLYYLTLIVGLPFFVVSTSAPLLQRWFVGTGHPAAKDPYFLYGASNLGSLLALLAYPFVVEPILPLHTQTWVWAVGYVFLVVLVFGCAFLVWRAPLSVQLAMAAQIDVPPPQEHPMPPPEVVTAIQPASRVIAGPARKKRGGRGKFKQAGRRFEEPATESAEGAASQRPEVMSAWRRLRWILLAFVPSSLMLGVISHVSTDLSPFPLLWVAPLTLYLLSFVLVFLRWPIPWTELPQTIIRFFHPLFVLGLVFVLLQGGFNPFWTTLLLFLAFFGVALYCHGELARDRPSPQYLTDYYLCLSVGGMLGGLFNGLLAPVLFTGVVEMPIAIVVAALLRPRPKEEGWTDTFLTTTFPGLGTWVRERGDNLARTFGKTPPRNHYLLSLVIDVVFALIFIGVVLFVKSHADNPQGWGWSLGWQRGSFKENPLFNILQKNMGFGDQSAASLTPKLYAILVYLIPMVFAFFWAHRWVRFGLGVLTLLLANLYFLDRDRSVIHADRSYFGVLRVLKQPSYIDDEEILPQLGKAEPIVGLYTSMMHGTTLHGQNYFEPPQLQRLATTYYHRLGPVGVVMERYNWFYGPQTTLNTFWADTRLPASLVGLGGVALGTGTLPLEQVVHTCSEPPYAVIGLGTGTMASYGRPFQHVTYYEIDDKVRNFSLPESERTTRDGEPFFTYLKGAKERGVNLEIIMGDARLTMQKETRQPGNLYPNREKYYKVMVIDAFSSDAIPVHLLTYEAVKLYSEKLAPDGVLCIHTSNRHLNLVLPGVDIAVKLGMHYRYGDDRSDRGATGHTGSNYLMLAWDPKALEFPVKNAPNFEQRSKVYADSKVEWLEPRSHQGAYLWTDDYSNIVRIMR